MHLNRPLLVFCAAAISLAAGPGIAQDTGAQDMGPQDMMGHDHAQTCDQPAPLPEGMASWAAPVPLQGTKDVRNAASSRIPPGQAFTLALLPTPKIRYPLRPEKPGGSVSYGGLASFTVKQAGTWRVALSAGAWVDIVQNGKAAQSVNHGRGPACTGIRKMVDYALTPGDYILQVAGNGTASITALVMELP